MKEVVKTQQFCAREALENDARQRGGAGGPRLPGQVGQSTDRAPGAEMGCLDPAHGREGCAAAGIQLLALTSALWFCPLSV